MASNETKVVVIGVTGSGKSTLCNVLFGKKRKGNEAGSFLVSATPDACTYETALKHGKWLGDGPNFTIIDTPGMGDPDGCDTEHIANMVAKLKQIQYVNAFVIVFNSQNPRLDRSLKSMMNIFSQMFGSKYFQNIIILFSRWHFDERSIDDRNEDGLTEDSQRKKWNAKFCEEFSLCHDLPIFFVDAHYKNNNDMELKAFQEQTSGLWSSISHMKTFDCKDIEAVKAEIDQLKEAKVKADIEKEKALEKARIADSEKEKTREKLRIADSEKEKAQEKLRLADSEKEKALEKVQIAEKERLAAVDREKKADSEKEKALEKARIAERKLLGAFESKEEECPRPGGALPGRAGYERRKSIQKAKIAERPRPGSALPRKADSEKEKAREKGQIAEVNRTKYERQTRSTGLSAGNRPSYGKQKWNTGNRPKHERQTRNTGLTEGFSPYYGMQTSYTGSAEGFSPYYGMQTSYTGLTEGYRPYYRMQTRNTEMASNETKVVVIGVTGSGKSTLCNVLFGMDPTGDEPGSFPVSAKSGACTYETALKHGKWLGDGPKFTIIDTPGMEDPDGRDTEHIADMVVKLKEIKYVNAFVIVFNSQNPRLDRSLESMIKIFSQMFGSEYFKNIIILFSRWRFDERSIEDRNKEGLTEDSQQTEWNAKFQAEFSLRHDLPMYFVDAHYRKNNDIELQAFKKQTSGLWSCICHMNRFDCKDIEAVKAEFDQLKEAKEKAEIECRSALEREKKADNEKKKAQETARFAEIKRQKAEVNEKQAVKEKNNAVEQGKKADQEKRKAESEKNKAEIERQQAELRREQAEEDCRMANTERKKKDAENRRLLEEQRQQRAARKRDDEERKMRDAELKRQEAEEQMKAQERLRKQAENECRQANQEKCQAIEKEHRAERERKKAEDEKKDADKRAKDLEKKRVKWYHFIPIAGPIMYGVKKA